MHAMFEWLPGSGVRADESPACRAPRRPTILARWFWCGSVVCGRSIFCEQFDAGVLARYGRRTQRLETIVHHLGLELGGKLGSEVGNRVMMPVSKDALLRVVLWRAFDRHDELHVIGIDDFGFLQGQTYGTIV